MQTSGIKIDINGSDKLLYDNSEKIEKVIKFAVKQAVAKKDAKTSEKSIDENGRTAVKDTPLND